jgi:hypothetical protein
MNCLKVCAVLFILFAQGCGNSKEMDIEEQITKSMQEFESRAIYSTLDRATLESIKDSELEQAIIDYIFVKIGDNFDKEYEIVNALSEGFKAVYTTWVVEAEVNNGGFNQYFWNSSGQFAMEAIAGFKELSALQHASLMENAVKIAIDEFPEIKKFKDIGTLEAFSESYQHTNLNELDDKFYDLKEDLSQLRISYIRANPQLFIAND